MSVHVIWLSLLLLCSCWCIYSAKSLPGRWKAYRDSSGRIFYFNHETNKSQWNIPVTIQDNDNISSNPSHTTYNSRRYVRPHRTKIKSKYFSRSDANHQVSEDKNVDNVVDSNQNENNEINKLNTSESSSLLHFKISHSSINSTLMVPSLDFNQSDVHIDRIVNTVIHAYRLSKGVYQWFSNNNRTSTIVSTPSIEASKSAHRPLRAGRKLSFLKTTKHSTKRKNRTIDVKRHDTTRSVSIAAQERAHTERLRIISQLTARLKELESQCEESDQKIARLCTENTALLSSTKREWDEKVEVCSIQSECINNAVLDLIETLCMMGRCLYPTTTVATATEYTVSNLPGEGELHSTKQIQAESVGFSTYMPVESLTNTTANTSATTTSTDNDNITSTTDTTAEVYIKEKQTQQGSLYTAALLAQLCVFLNTQSNSINVVNDTQCTQPISTITCRDASSSDHTPILRQTLENNQQEDLMLQQIDSLQQSVVQLQRQNTALCCELELANCLLCQLRGQTFTYPNTNSNMASIVTTGTTTSIVTTGTTISSNTITTTATEGIDFKLERKIICNTKI